MVVVQPAPPIRQLLECACRRSSKRPDRFRHSQRQRLRIDFVIISPAPAVNPLDGALTRSRKDVPARLKRPTLSVSPNRTSRKAMSVSLPARLLRSSRSILSTTRLLPTIQRTPLQAVVLPRSSLHNITPLQTSTQSINMSTTSAAAASHDELNRNSLFNLKGRVALVTGWFPHLMSRVFNR